MGEAESAFQRAFAGGELSPSVSTRADLVKYQIGLKMCRNFLVRRSGGVSNRSGTRFVNPLKVNSANHRLFPYISEVVGESLLIEAGSGYFRFYQNGGLVTLTGVDAWSNAIAYVAGDIVVEAGVNYYCILAHTNQVPPNATYWYAMPDDILEVPHPFTQDGIARTVQSGRVITLTHPGVQPQELIYGSLTQWVVRPIVTASSMAAPTGLTATPGTAGALRYAYVVTAAAPKSFEESPASSPVVIPACGAPTPEGMHTIGWGAVTGAEEYYVYCDPYNNGTFGYIGTTTQLQFHDPGFEPEFIVTPPIPRTLFNQAGDYPSIAAYHQQRRFFGQTYNEPELIAGSRTGFPANFNVSSPLQDDDAIAFKIAGNQHNPVRHLVGLKVLLAMTDGGVWPVGRPNELIAPANIPADQQTYVGSSDVPPVVVGSTVIYVQARGTQVRDLRFTREVDGFAGQDLTVFASHLFDGHTIDVLAFALVPHSTVWAVRDDGVLLGLTYVPEQDVWGWHRHDTLHGAVEQVCIVPEADEDAVYLTVRRTLNGATVRLIERMARRDVEDIADAFFMDCGLSYDDVPASTFSGLDHLEGELVAILADGVVVSDGTATAYRVVGGQVALPTPASKVHVGLPIQFAEIEMLNFDVDGVVIRDKKKRVASVSAILDKSARAFQAGPDTSHLKTYERPSYDPTDALYDGLVDLNIEARFSEQARLVIRQVSPLPLTVLGLIPRVEVGG